MKLIINAASVASQSVGLAAINASDGADWLRRSSSVVSGSILIRARRRKDNSPLLTDDPAPVTIPARLKFLVTQSVPGALMAASLGCR